MKHIFINGRFLSQKTTGVQRYASELVIAIDCLLGEREYEAKNLSVFLLVPPNGNNALNLKNITIRKVGKFTGHLWEQIELPIYSRKGMLVGFCNTGPILKKNQVVTFCDASVFRVSVAYSVFFRVWYKILFKVVGSFAKKLITISLFSRNELVDCIGISPVKFTITYPGINHQKWAGFEKGQSPNKLLSRKPFVLAVSSMSPHKNFSALIEAVKIIGEADFEIYIVGGGNTSVFKNSTIQLPTNVMLLGYVADEELKELYRNANCFIYPSLYEGFGLPPLEAMYNGCPVIVARSGALPEVCGDAAFYCDPYDPEDIAEKICLMMTNDNLRNEFREKGLSQARLYTWEKCARATLSTILEAINQ